jgi:DNA-binding beta-propeller fold protein YncE
MKQSPQNMWHFVAFTALLCGSFSGCKSQPEFGAGLLHLERVIPLHGVKGRIDHMDINLKDQVVYIAALGNNTLEAVSLLTGKVVHSIKGLAEPQGVSYIPQHREVFVANGGNGDCYFYNATNFERTATIHLSSDADNVRYDSCERKIYVGYGSGGIAVIDADSHKEIGQVALPAHPEGFQLDKRLNHLFVNMPDADMIGVVDLKRMMMIDKWERNSPRANFPMAIDTVRHRVFVGYRHPASLMVFDGLSGKELSASAVAGDADDVYYDQVRSHVLISGGDGHVSIFHEEGGRIYKQVANISTGSGARTSLLIAPLKLFIVAVRATPGLQATLYVYSVQQ